MPIIYPPDPEPEGYDVDGRPWWSNGKSPGSMRQRRRVAIARLTVLARLLYEGAEFETGEGGTVSWMAGPHDTDQISFMFTVDRSTFWRRFRELQEERRWEL